uniref:Transmembrane protein n=1 Tax=Medicago truncatula TaxID=3880 RepID=I3S053_MEDTR|nr:unknown [Medicago truncatula]
MLVLQQLLLSPTVTVEFFIIFIFIFGAEA